MVDLLVRTTRAVILNFHNFPKQFFTNWFDIDNFDTMEICGKEMFIYRIDDIDFMELAEVGKYITAIELARNMNRAYKFRFM